MEDSNTNGVDERLMATQRASELREEKNKDKKGGEPEEGVSDGEQEGDIRQSKLAALKEKVNIKKRIKKKIKEKVLNPAKLATGNALKWAWGVLIPSFGLSLIYINMHVFLRFLFPDAFCKLGEEWIPKGIGGESTAKNVAGTAFGIVEIMGLLLLDIVAFFIIGAALALIIEIITWMSASLLEKLGMIWDAFKSLGWATLNGLRELFSN